MGYFSDLRVTVTKDDYDKMVKKDSKNFGICKCFLDDGNAYISEFCINGIKCILIGQYDFKYYNEFEEVQQFEKYLKQAKDGYVFLRIGGKYDDIEYRNTAKLKELETPFNFIEVIRNEERLKQANEEEFE